MTKREDVLKVASLARLRLSDADVDKVQKRFTAILSYFEFLKEANTEGVPPSFHGLDHMNLREDIPEAPLPREELLQNAPEQFENCFKIPKVVGAVE